MNGKIYICQHRSKDILIILFTIIKTYWKFVYYIRWIHLHIAIWDIDKKVIYLWLKLMLYAFLYECGVRINSFIVRNIVSCRLFFFYVIEIQANAFKSTCFLIAIWNPYIKILVDFIYTHNNKKKNNNKLFLIWVDVHTKRPMMVLVAVFFPWKSVWFDITISCNMQR